MKKIVAEILVFLLVFAVFAGISEIIVGIAKSKQSFKAESTSTPVATQQTVGFACEAWQVDYSLFREGMTFVNASQPNYEAGLACFRKIMASFPEAIDVDYAYGWGAYCLAKLGRFDECLCYYQILRQRYYGAREGGASGALRLWDNRLEEIRKMAEVASTQKSLAALEAMRGLDKEALARFGEPKFPH